MTSLRSLSPGSLWRPPTGAGYGPLPGMLLMLTIVTGLVDAVSILALGRVFVANMTGNVVFAGFALVGAPGFSLGASLFALAGFLAGAAAGGSLGTRAGRDRALQVRAAAGAELILLAIALVIALASGDRGTAHGLLGIGGAPFGAAITDTLAAVLAVAMGIQNSAARTLAIPDLTTTVLTMTLTGLGADSRSGHRGHQAVARRLLVVATMAAGGAGGAWLVLHSGAAVPLGIATGLVAVTAGWATLTARRPGVWRSPG